MNQYIKIPIHTYKGSELNAFERNIINDTDDELDDIDRIVKQSARNVNSEEPTLKPIITWMRIPLEDFRGVIYDATTAIENSEEEFATGKFTSSLLMFKDDFQVTCAWSVEELEDNLINFGVVSPMIKLQKEIL